ncbi:glycine zipper domain-containing protein [Pseudomonas sp. MYb118]|uniref:glycine zipper domain-containing protein n=1 Tax=Pseudomonas sp. MYb118 TaxID=1848720 RepID=UPI0034CF2E23
MADSKYSMSEATLDSFGFSTFNVASVPYGLSGFSGAMAQLGAALNEASLDIRLLTVEQGKLGEVISSLTAALFAPRSQLRTFSQAPGARDESPFRLNVEVQPRPSLESPRLMAHQADNHTCQCELKSPLQVLVEQQILQASAQPIAPPTDSSPASVNPNEASLARLKSAVTPDFSSAIDKVSSFAEEHPKLAVVGGLLYSAGARLVEKVIDEAYSKAAERILGGSTGKEQPAENAEEGKGKYKGTSKGKKKKGARSKSPSSPDDCAPCVGSHPEKCTGALQPDCCDCCSLTPSHKTDQVKYKLLEGHDRIPLAPLPEPRLKLTSATADTQAVTSTLGLNQAQNLVAPDNPAKTGSLLGKAAKAVSIVDKTVAPLRMVGAAIDITQGIANGDTKAVVSSAGSLVGSTAGAAAGAAIGTMIFPGVGTAIGGLVGGLAGSEVGAMLGEKLFGLVDRLRTPDQVSKDLTTAAAPPGAPINFAPSIQVTCPNADNAEQIRNVVAQQLQAQFHGEFVPLMNHNALATRRDAALTDGGV